MVRRRRATWRSVIFNLLLFAVALLASFTTAAAAAETKPSCAACLSTGRAVERALSNDMGEVGSHHHHQQQQQQQQLQRRRGRAFPAFASEPAVAAALAPSTCDEVRVSSWFPRAFSSSSSSFRVLFCFK